MRFSFVLFCFALFGLPGCCLGCCFCVVLCSSLFVICSLFFIICSLFFVRFSLFSALRYVFIFLCSSFYFDDVTCRFVRLFPNSRFLCLRPRPLARIVLCVGSWGAVSAASNVSVSNTCTSCNNSVFHCAHGPRAICNTSSKRSLDEHANEKHKTTMPATTTTITHGGGEVDTAVRRRWRRPRRRRR